MSGPLERRVESTRAYALGRRDGFVQALGWARTATPEEIGEVYGLAALCQNWNCVAPFIGGDEA